MWEALAFAAIWSGILQAGIITFWSHAVRAENVPAMFFAAFIGLACTLGSMTYSSATWLMRTNRVEFQRTLTRSNASTVIEPVAAFSKTINGVATRMADVAGTAESKAATEIASGGTCEGIKPQKDCGLVCRLRKRQQTDSSNLSNDLAGVAQQSTDIISSIQADLSRDGMIKGFKKATELGRSSALTNAKVWLDAQIRGFDTKFIDPQTGAAVACKDPDFRNQLAEARKVLDADLSLPGVPPEPVTVGYSDAATKSINDVMQLVRAIIFWNFDKTTFASMHDSAVGLAIAGFIELMIIFLVIKDTKDLKRWEAFGTDSEHFIFTNRRMQPDKLAKLADLGRIVDRFTFRSNSMNELLFLRPLDGLPETVAKCSDIVRLFQLPFSKRQIKVIDREIVEDWARLNDDLTQGARTFEVRVLTPQLERQLRIVARDSLFLPRPALNDNPAPANAGRALTRV